MANPVYLVSDETRTVVPFGVGEVPRSVRPYPDQFATSQWAEVVFALIADSPAGVRLVGVDEQARLSVAGYLQVVRDNEAAAFASDPDPGEVFQSFADFLMSRRGATQPQYSAVRGPRR
jgi:hypothetical protein